MTTTTAVTTPRHRNNDGGGGGPPQQLHYHDDDDYDADPTSARNSYLMTGKKMKTCHSDARTRRAASSSTSDGNHGGEEAGEGGSSAAATTTPPPPRFGSLEELLSVPIDVIFLHSSPPPPLNPSRVLGAQHRRWRQRWSSSPSSPPQRQQEEDPQQQHRFFAAWPTPQATNSDANRSAPPPSHRRHHQDGGTEFVLSSSTKRKTVSSSAASPVSTHRTHRPLLLLSRAEAHDIMCVRMLAQEFDSIVDRYARALDTKVKCRATLRQLVRASTAATSNPGRRPPQEPPRIMAPQLLPLASMLDTLGDDIPNQTLLGLDRELQQVADELRRVSQSVRSSSDQNWTISESLFVDSDALRGMTEPGPGPEVEEDGEARPPSAVEYLAKAKRALSDVQDELVLRIEALLEQRLTHEMLDVSMEQFCRTSFDGLVVLNQHLDLVDNEEEEAINSKASRQPLPMLELRRRGAGTSAMGRSNNAQPEEMGATAAEANELVRELDDSDDVFDDLRYKNSGPALPEEEEVPLAAAAAAAAVAGAGAAAASADTAPPIPPSPWTIPFGQATPPTTRPSNPSTQQHASQASARSVPPFSSSPAVEETDLVEGEDQDPCLLKSPTGSKAGASTHQAPSPQLDSEEKENSQLQHQHQHQQQHPHPPCVKDVMEMALSNASSSGGGGVGSSSIYTASQEAEASHAVARVLAGMTSTSTTTPPSTVPAAAASTTAGTAPTRTFHKALEDDDES